MQNKIIGVLGFLLVLLLVTNASAVACSSPANCGSADVDTYEVTVSYQVAITDWDCSDYPHCDNPDDPNDCVMHEV